jgi:hypothetical protein
MATEVQFRSGTTAEVAAFTGAATEAVVDNEEQRWLIHDGVLAGGHPTPNFRDVLNNRYNSVTAAGTDTLTGSVTQAPDAYVDLMSVFIETPNANTGAVTFNLNSLGAKDVVQVNGDALVSGDLLADGIYLLIYSATKGDWVMLGGGGGSAAGPAGRVKFNAAGTIAGSDNVTSVTDNGVGDWTVNWDVDFSDTNYTVALSHETTGGADRQFFLVETSGQAVGSLTVALVNSVGSRADGTNMHVAAWGS